MTKTSPPTKEKYFFSEKIDRYIAERNKVISAKFYNNGEINDERKTTKYSGKPMV